MEMNCDNKNGIGIITIKGRLDASNHEVFKRNFHTYLSVTKQFVIDLSNLEFIDSTGLGSLVACLKNTINENGDIKIANLGEKPKMVFDITRAYKIFDIHENVDTAITAFKK